MEDTTKFRYVSDAATMLTAATVQEPAIGEIVYVMDEEKLYVYTPHGYELYAPTAANESGLNMSLYDLNKAVVSQLHALDNDALENCMKQMNGWHCEVENKFYMLYGKEISYFTVIHITGEFEGDISTFGEAVIDCLENIGDICSIELTEDKSAFEIWVNQDNVATCLYLFPYDTGIVKVWM